jgi:hypothetical protein
MSLSACRTLVCLCCAIRDMCGLGIGHGIGVIERRLALGYHSDIGLFEVSSPNCPSFSGLI